MKSAVVSPRGESKKKEIEIINVKDLPNHFTNERKDQVNSFYVRFKVYICWALAIIPLRIFHLFFWFFGYGLFYMLSDILCRKIFRSEKMAGYVDSVCRNSTPVFSWMMLISFGFWKRNIIEVDEDLFQKICLKYQKTTETFPEKKKPNIIICNHISYTDGVFIFREFGEVGILAKMGLKGDGIMKFMLTQLGSIFTDGKNIVRELIRRCDYYYDHAEDHRQFIIFPEGTTSNGKYLFTFHKGAFIPGRPVQPYMIRYKYKYFDPSLTPAGSDFQYLESLYSQIYQTAYCLKFPYYNPTNAEKQDPKLYAENVRSVMKEVHDYYLKDLVGEITKLNILAVRHTHLKKKEK